MTPGRTIATLAAALMLAAGAMAPVSAEGDGGLFVTSPSQPPNVGDAMIAAQAYHDGGSYDRDVDLVALQAEAWIATRAPAATKPALVLDVDETVLSNWEIIQRDNFGRPIGGACDLATDGPCGWAAWDQLGRDPPIAPMLRLYRNARAQGVAVFFITGRPESQRQATERNLEAAGFAGYEKLHVAPDGVHFATATDFKTPVRAGIEAAGYTIIANIGDQPSDLFGGHAERIYLLPNPFYRVR